MPAVPLSPDPDPTRCPVCQGENRCAMEEQRRTGQAQPPCWCTSASFPADVLDRIPVSARGKACVCAACVGQPAP